MRKVKPKTNDFSVGVSIDQHILVVFFGRAKRRRSNGAMEDLRRFLMCFFGEYI